MLTYDEVRFRFCWKLSLLTFGFFVKVARILTTALGRPIKHRVVSGDEVVGQYVAFGLPEESAKFLVQTELELENGSAEKLVTDEKYAVARRVGKVGVKEYVEKNKALWLK